MADLDAQNSEAKTVCDNRKPRIMEPAVNTRKSLLPNILNIKPRVPELDAFWSRNLKANSAFSELLRDFGVMFCPSWSIQPAIVSDVTKAVPSDPWLSWLQGTERTAPQSCVAWGLKMTLYAPALGYFRN